MRALNHRQAVALRAVLAASIAAKDDYVFTLSERRTAHHVT